MFVLLNPLGEDRRSQVWVDASVDVDTALLMMIPCNETRVSEQCGYHAML